MKRNKLTGNIFADITPIKNLTWHTELGYDLSWSDAEVFTPTMHLGNWDQDTNKASWQKNTSKYWQFKNYITYNGSIKSILSQPCWVRKLGAVTGIIPIRKTLICQTI